MIFIYVITFIKFSHVFPYLRICLNSSACGGIYQYTVTAQYRNIAFTVYILLSIINSMITQPSTEHIRNK
jgi:hypothetical protein